MVKIIEISNSFTQSIRIEGNVLTYKEGRKKRTSVLYSYMVDEEDLILITGVTAIKLLLKKQVYTVNISNRLLED